MFDSQQVPNTGQAVYMACVAEQLAPPDDKQAMAIFSRRSVEHGIGEWPVERVRDAAHLRVYRATVQQHSMLDKSGSGPRYDHRVQVEL